MPLPAAERHHRRPQPSAKARISAGACSAPPPTHSIGAFASFSSFAKRVIFRDRAWGRRHRQRVLRVTSAAAENWSSGISSATGPRRPDSISWNAGPPDRRLRWVLDPFRPFQQAAQRGQLIGKFMQLAAKPADHRAGTCPVRHSTGALTPQAVARAAVVFNTPGPGRPHRPPAARRAGVTSAI